MVQQMQSACNVCKGEGTAYKVICNDAAFAIHLYIYRHSNWNIIFSDIFSGEMISQKDKCTTCQGKKTVKENKVLEVSEDLPPNNFALKDEAPP